MNKIAVVTDSNSGITQSQASHLRAQGQPIYVLPMPVIIDGTEHFEDIDLTQQIFYAKLAEGAVVRTSQPATGDVVDLWDCLLNDFDQIVHIPMSSGLSKAYDTALILAQDYDGRVAVVDNHRISVTQRQSVLDAAVLATNGFDASEIYAHLERTKYDSSIYIMVDTLKYLASGGRLTPAAAAFGAIFRIKPVLQIQGERLDAYAKVLGVKQARKTMIKAMQTDFANRFGVTDIDSQMNVFFAYTHDEQTGIEFRQEACQALNISADQLLDPLSLSVSCHIGPGALAIACSKKLDLSTVERL